MTVSVVISNNSRATDKMYTYLVAPNDELRIKTGMRVKVPFGKSHKLYEAYQTDPVRRWNAWNRRAP